MASVHPTAIVAPGAQLAGTASIGPYAVIGAQVSIGEGSSVAAHCVIDGRTTIGRDNRIFAFCSLGAVPQDKKYAGEPTELRIGDRNTIREFCTLNLGTAQGGGVTSLGDDNWIMAYVHLAHDCRVGNQTIFANNASLAGHVEIGDWVILGGFTGVHQFTKVGAHAMTGMNTSLTQDLPPFVMASGNPASARGLNLEGLRRRGFSTERLSAIKRMQRLLYREGLSLEAAKAAIAALADERPQARDDIALMTDFLGRSTRGVLR